MHDLSRRMVEAKWPNASPTAATNRVVHQPEFSLLAARAVRTSQSSRARENNCVSKVFQPFARPCVFISTRQGPYRYICEILKYEAVTKSSHSILVPSPINCRLLVHPALLAGFAASHGTPSIFFKASKGCLTFSDCPVLRVTTLVPCLPPVTLTIWAGAISILLSSTIPFAETRTTTTSIRGSIKAQSPVLAAKHRWTTDQSCPVVNDQQGSNRCTSIVCAQWVFIHRRRTQLHPSM